MALKALEFLVPTGPITTFCVQGNLVVPVGTVVTRGLLALPDVPTDGCTKDLKSLLGIRKRKAVEEEEAAEFVAVAARDSSDDESETEDSDYSESEPADSDDE